VLGGGMGPGERAAAFREALAQRGERLLGRAAAELASLLISRDYECFAEMKCSRSLLGARHVHIDGAGHVFPGTCVGIVVGNLRTGVHRSMEEMWRHFDYREHPIMSVLVEKGPVGLLGLAQESGYEVRPGYASGCHLCYEVRRFLYGTGRYRAQLGPGACYGVTASAASKGGIQQS
jgi:hypothetical protein